jgi:hypothetical protein
MMMGNLDTECPNGDPRGQLGGPSVLAMRSIAKAQVNATAMQQAVTYRSATLAARKNRLK